MATSGFAFGFEAPSDAAFPGTVVATTRPAVEHAPSEEAAYAAHWPTSTCAWARGCGSGSRPTRCRSSTTRKSTDARRLRGQLQGGSARNLLEVMEARAAGALTLHGARVLEAGCGAGLPGVLALRRGCASLVLQDFNSEVLRTTTMATLRRNGGWEAAERGAVRFVSGDWASVSAKLTDEHGRRGAPPTSARRGQGGGDDGRRLRPHLLDTIYSPAATPALWSLIRAQLRPNGVALVAAKSYYFGVGGSTADFCALVAADARFVCEAIRVFEDGKSNRREVLEVRRRDQAAAAPPEPAAPRRRRRRRARRSRQRRAAHRSRRHRNRCHRSRRHRKRRCQAGPEAAAAEGGGGGGGGGGGRRRAAEDAEGRRRSSGRLQKFRERFSVSDPTEPHTSVRVFRVAHKIMGSRTRSGVEAVGDAHHPLGDRVARRRAPAAPPGAGRRRGRRRARRAPRRRARRRGAACRQPTARGRGRTAARRRRRGGGSPRRGRGAPAAAPRSQCAKSCGSEGRAAGAELELRVPKTETSSGRPASTSAASSSSASTPQPPPPGRPPAERRQAGAGGAAERVVAAAAVRGGGGGAPRRGGLGGGGEGGNEVGARLAVRVEREARGGEQEEGEDFRCAAPPRLVDASPPPSTTATDAHAGADRGAAPPTSTHRRRHVRRSHAPPGSARRRRGRRRQRWRVDLPSRAGPATPSTQTGAGAARSAARRRPRRQLASAAVDVRRSGGAALPVRAAGSRPVAAAAVRATATAVRTARRRPAAARAARRGGRRRARVDPRAAGGDAPGGRALLDAIEVGGRRAAGGDVRRLDDAAIQRVDQLKPLHPHAGEAARGLQLRDDARTTRFVRFGVALAADGRRREAAREERGGVIVRA